MQGAAATPTVLIKAMAEHGRNANLRDVKLCAMHTEGLAEYTDPALEKVFRSTSFFMGGNVRKAVAEGRADCVPIFLHEIPQLFHKKIYCPDVALISVRNLVSICARRSVIWDIISGIASRPTRLLLFGHKRWLCSGSIAALEMYCWWVV